MTKKVTGMNDIIANAKRETGIRENEYCIVHNVSIDENLYEFVLETEWSRVTCYADTESGEILGIMSEAKSVEELYLPRIKSAQIAFGRKAA